MPNLSPETRAEWRRRIAEGDYGLHSNKLCGERILALLDALEEAEAKLAVRREEPGDLGPQWLVAGQYALHSGGSTHFKIDCDALTDEELRTAAMLLVERLPPFGSVESVPTGGDRLASMLREFATEGPVLIVDDVCTTGGSLEKARGGRLDVIGAVIFARGRYPEWVTPLFLLNPADELARLRPVHVSAAVIRHPAMIAARGGSR